MTWSKKHIEQLLKDGKIRAFSDTKVPKNETNFPKSEILGRIVTKHFKKRSKAKDWIGWNLLYWANKNKLQLQEEYKFHEERKWRFDWALPAAKIAVEFEGGIHDRNGSHTSVKDIMRDTEKYNAAAGMNWKVFRFNAMNYKTLITELNKIL